jgi:hypothetical protein
MLRELVLELEDGRKARLRFTETAEATTSTPCEGSKGCEHEVTPERAALIFRAIDVDYDGDALRSAQTVMMQNKAELLFQALHTSPGFLDNPQFQICPPTWDDQSTSELLELYLTGFTPQMLAKHFQVGIRAIIRHLSFVVWGDEHLTQDPTKARHQKPWHNDEILFLASQMQIGRTPTEISTLMDRDGLGIAFKLFEALPVPIPRAVLDHYSITIRTQPLGHVPLDGKPF